MSEKRTDNKIKYFSLDPGTSFEEFKNKFYSQYRDPTIFDCNDINLLKVILDGLKVNYVSKKITDTSIFQPWFILFIKFIKWKIQFKKFKKVINPARSAHILILEEDWFIEDSNKNTYSFYFQNIYNYLPKDSYIIVHATDNYKIQELSLSYLQKHAYSCFSTIKYFKYIFRIRKFYRKIKKNSLFSETDLKNIQTSLTNFFFQFVAFDNFISRSKSNIKTFLFDQHYHREGILYACKKNNIKTVELQHGLISEKDIFYCFPECVKKIKHKMLMPDEIWCWGEYWKKVLLKGSEWEEKQIKIIGDFIYRGNTEDKKIPYESFLKNEPFYLITTQTFLHEYFINFTINFSNYLNSKKIYKKIIVKIHPNEVQSKYQSLNSLTNVLVVSDALDFLLRHCECNITIYSTTVFDALRYNKISFCLYYESFKDYLEEYAAHPFVRIIQPHNFEKINPNASIPGYIDKKYYYDSFNYKLLDSL